MVKKNFLESIYLILLGVVSAFSLPPYNYFLLNFITFSLFFVFLHKERINNNKKLIFFKYGWLFGFGYFLSGLYWVSIALTFDENFKFLIPISLIAVPSFLAIFYAMVTLFFSIFFSKKILISFLMFTALFGTVEFIRGSIFTGFPWNLIVFSLSKNILFLQILSIIGTYSLNLICITLFTLPALLILKKSKKNILLFTFFIVIALSFLIFGKIKIDQFNSKKINKLNYSIRVISSNIDLDRFYLKKNEIEIISELIKISNPKMNNPTIFLWPEGVVTETYLDDIKIYKDIFSKNFSKNHLIILGGNTFDDKDDKNLYFNSLGVFDNNLNLINKYNKINLVPFGEFLPLENFLNMFGLKTITNNYESFTSGKSRKLIKIKNNKFQLNLLPLICYEIIYSGKLFKNSNFDYIINVSEDGWFGKSIGPKQHFAHSIFRSIESGKYIFRSANNGISAIINPIGKTDKNILQDKAGYIDFNESKSIEMTLFAKYGNKIFIFLILLYIFLIFSFNKIKNE